MQFLSHFRYQNVISKLRSNPNVRRYDSRRYLKENFYRNKASDKSINRSCSILWRQHNAQGNALG